MKKSTLTTIIVLAVLALLVVWGISTYNGMVAKKNNVDKYWANVESQYQMRNDKIAQLVATTKGMAIYESQYMQDVISARARATQVTIDPSNLTAEQWAEYQSSQSSVSSAFSRLLMNVESYPEVKASQHFMALMDEISGTENRINEARILFNDAANIYNIAIQRFPSNIIANMFGFKERLLFEADPAAKTAPTIDFSDLKHE